VWWRIETRRRIRPAKSRRGDEIMVGGQLDQTATRVVLLAWPFEASTFNTAKLTRKG
jgi:hypothetical protein